MYKKRALVLGGYLSLLALAACGPKVVDDSDLVSIDYKYTFADGEVVEQGSKDLIIGESVDLAWIENVIRGAKVEDEFTGGINGKVVYKSEYNPDLVQSYSYIQLTEPLGVDNPIIGAEVDVNSIGHGIITEIGKDSEGYDSYVVEFNEPKTYSDLIYSFKITNIEKN